eukprot:PhM_4_TR13712/c0_g1_i1/m.81540
MKVGLSRRAFVITIACVILAIVEAVVAAHSSKNRAHSFSYALPLGHSLVTEPVLKTIFSNYFSDNLSAKVSTAIFGVNSPYSSQVMTDDTQELYAYQVHNDRSSSNKQVTFELSIAGTAGEVVLTSHFTVSYSNPVTVTQCDLNAPLTSQCKNRQWCVRHHWWNHEHCYTNDVVCGGHEGDCQVAAPNRLFCSENVVRYCHPQPIIGTVTNTVQMSIKSNVTIGPSPDGTLAFTVTTQDIVSETHQESFELGSISKLGFQYSVPVAVYNKTRDALLGSITWFCSYRGLDQPALPMLVNNLLDGQRVQITRRADEGTAISLQYNFTSVVSAPSSYLMFLMGSALYELTSQTETAFAPTACHRTMMPPTNWSQLLTPVPQPKLTLISGIRLTKALLDAGLWVAGNAGVFHEDSSMKALDAYIHFISNMTIPLATVTGVNKVLLTTPRGHIEGNCSANKWQWNSFVNLSITNISVHSNLKNFVDPMNADNVSFGMEVESITFDGITLDEPKLPIPSTTLSSLGEKIVNLTRNPMNRALGQHTLNFPPPRVPRAEIVRAPRASIGPQNCVVGNNTYDFGFIEIASFCDQTNNPLSNFPPCSNYGPMPTPAPTPTPQPTPSPLPPSNAYTFQVFESEHPCNVNTTGSGAVVIEAAGTASGLCMFAFTRGAASFYWRLDSISGRGVTGAFMCSSSDCSTASCASGVTTARYGECYGLGGNVTWSLFLGKSPVCNYIPDDNGVVDSGDSVLAMSLDVGCEKSMISYTNIGPTAPMCFLNSTLNDPSGPTANAPGISYDWVGDSCYHNCCGPAVPDDHCNYTVPTTPNASPVIECVDSKFTTNTSCVNVSTAFSSQFMSIVPLGQMCVNQTTVRPRNNPNDHWQLIVLITTSCLFGPSILFFAYLYVAKPHVLHHFWRTTARPFTRFVCRPLVQFCQWFSAKFTQRYDAVADRVDVFVGQFFVTRPAVKFHIGEEWEHSAVMATCASCFFALAITWSLYNPFMKILSGDSQGAGLPSHLHIKSTADFFKDWNYYGVFVCQLGIIMSFICVIVPTWLRRVEVREDGGLLYKTVGSAKLWCAIRAFVVTALLMILGGVITVPPFFLDVQHAIELKASPDAFISDPESVHDISVLLSISLAMFTLPLVLQLLLFFFSGMPIGIFVGVILRHYSNRRYREAGEDLDSILLDQNQVSLIHMLSCSLLPTFEMFVVMSIFQALDTPMLMLVLWFSHAFLSFSTVPCLYWLFAHPDRLDKYGARCVAWILVCHLALILAISSQPCRLFNDTHFFVVLNLATTILCVLVLLSIRRSILVVARSERDATEEAEHVSSEPIFAAIYINQRTVETAPRWVPRGSLLRWLFQSEEIENWKDYGYRLWWRRLAIILATGCIYVVLTDMYHDVHDNTTRQFVVEQLQNSGIRDASNATALFDAGIDVYQQARSRQLYATMPCAVFLSIAVLADAFFPGRATLRLSSAMCLLCFLQSLIALLFITLPDYVGGSDVEQYLPHCAPEFNGTLLWAARTAVSLVFSGIILSNIIPVLIFFPPTAVRVLGLVARDKVLQEANGRLLLLFVSFLTPIVVSLPLVILYQAIRDSLIFYISIGIMVVPLVIGFCAQHLQIVPFMSFFYIWMTSYLLVWVALIYRVCTLQSGVWEHIAPMLRSAEFYCSVVLEVALTSVSLTDVMLGLLQTSDDVDLHRWSHVARVPLLGPQRRSDAPLGEATSVLEPDGQNEQ